MKLATKIVLAFTMMMLLAGCFSSLYPPPRKAMLMFTSPPQQSMLICDADDMTPEMLQLCMRYTQNKPFKDYKFNENFSINLNATGIQDVDRSNTDTTTVTSGRSATVTDNRPPDEKGL